MALEVRAQPLHQEDHALRGGGAARAGRGARGPPESLKQAASPRSPAGAGAGAAPAPAPRGVAGRSLGPGLRGRGPDAGAAVCRPDSA
eukprot:13749879-Heterocapsa_arctica.AAC.1